MRFGWNFAKGERSRRERSFDFAALILEGDTIEWPGDRTDHGQARVRAIGEVDGLLLHVVAIDRNDVRRFISARLANRKERNRWHGSR